MTLPLNGEVVTPRNELRSIGDAVVIGAKMQIFLGDELITTFAEPLYFVQEEGIVTTC